MGNCSCSDNNNRMGQYLPPEQLRKFTIKELLGNYATVLEEQSLAETMDLLNLRKFLRANAKEKDELSFMTVENFFTYELIDQSSSTSEQMKKYYGEVWEKITITKEFIKFEEEYQATKTLIFVCEQKGVNDAYDWLLTYNDLASRRQFTIKEQRVLDDACFALKNNPSTFVLPGLKRRYHQALLNVLYCS